MAARLVRRTFAAPFVITLAAACSGPVYTNPPPPLNPPHGNPPMPDPTPPPPGPVTTSTVDLVWNVTTVDGGCQAFHEMH